MDKEEKQNLEYYVKEKLESYLDPCYHTSNYSHIYCRCPHCGDSKNKSSAHFYIKLTAPFPFYCQKCGYSGSLNYEVLDSLAIYDNELNEALSKVNNSMIKSVGKIVKNKADKTVKIEETEDEQSALALQYLNNRFNSNISLEQANKQFRCITKPNEYIEYVFRKKTSYSVFDFSKAIGFLSSDNKYMICRDVTNTQRLRYMNVPLTQDDDKSKIYNIKTPINILNPSITLVITEGIFDCIGIYLAEYQDKENVICAAGCGKSYIQVIEKFISMGFLNLNVKFYADADVSLQFFKNEKNKCDYIKNEKVEVYYNTLEKDCGVPIDRIKLRKTII